VHILYPYNELLPKHSAHDVYIWRNCLSLAQSGAEVTLAIGTGSQNEKFLHQHYQSEPHANFHVRRFAMLRKNFGLPFTWNWVFLNAAQKEITRSKPDWVIMSVLKQGLYHLARRIQGVRYCYEVHELQYYPNKDIHAFDAKQRTRLDAEVAMLRACDLVTVTTTALANILKAAPYSLSHERIAVIPLAAKSNEALHPLHYREHEPFSLGYVGQLYKGQGIERLIEALALTPAHIQLTVVGGSVDDIARLQEHARQQGVSNRIRWLGFQPPSTLNDQVASVHAFVAPFDNTTRMPYVAHTKLVDYTAWGRPFIAPRLPVVVDELHGVEEPGCVLYAPDDTNALAEAIRQLAVPAVYARVSQIATSDEWLAKALGWNERSTQLNNRLLP
jgi:glycosyltransferase involved in cell wall biosynthesis